MAKKIGILTSGGDCAGLNAVVRAATLRAINQYKWKVYGIKDGTLGLLTDPLDVIELKTSHFDGNLMRMGGTFLGSNNKPLISWLIISLYPSMFDAITTVLLAMASINIIPKISYPNDGANNMSELTNICCFNSSLTIPCL